MGRMPVGKGQYILGGPEQPNDWNTWNYHFLRRADVPCLRFMLDNPNAHMLQRPSEPRTTGLTWESERAGAYEQDLWRWETQHRAHENLKGWVHGTVSRYIFNHCCRPNQNAFQWRVHIDRLVRTWELRRTGKARAAQRTKAVPNLKFEVLEHAPSNTSLQPRDANNERRQRKEQYRAAVEPRTDNKPAIQNASPNRQVVPVAQQPLPPLVVVQKTSVEGSASQETFPERQVMPVAQQPLPALAAAVSDGVESPTAHDVSSVMDVDVVAPQLMSPVASDRDDAIQPETGLGTVATRERETQLVPARQERVVRPHRKGEPVLRCLGDLEEWSSRFIMKATVAGLLGIIANPDLPFPLDAPVPPDPKDYFYSRQGQTDLDGMEEARNALGEWQKDWMSYVAERACYNHQVEAHTELRDWMLNTVKIDENLDDEDQRWYSPTDNVRELWTKLMAVMNDRGEWAAPDEAGSIAEDSEPRTHWPRKWTGAYMRAWALRDAEECVYTTMGGWKSTSIGPSTVDHADPPQLEQAPPGTWRVNRASSRNLPLHWTRHLPLFPNRAVQLLGKTRH